MKGKWLDVGILRIGAGLAGGYPPLALATLRQDQPCSAKKQALYISTFSSETGTLLGKDSMFHFKILLVLCIVYCIGVTWYFHLCFSVLHSQGALGAIFLGLLFSRSAIDSE